MTQKIGKIDGSVTRMKKDDKLPAQRAEEIAVIPA